MKRYDLLGAAATWDDGDRLVYGARGEVTGPSDDDDSVEVRFAGNAEVVDCLLADLGRTPPLPAQVEAAAGSEQAPSCPREFRC
jgi:hypothetical protein